MIGCILLSLEDNVAVPVNQVCYQPPPTQGEK